MSELNLNFDDSGKDLDQESAIPGVAPTPTLKQTVVPGGKPASEEPEQRKFFSNKAANIALISVGALLGVFIVVGIIATLL